MPNKLKGSRCGSGTSSRREMPRREFIQKLGNSCLGTAVAVGLGTGCSSTPSSESGPIKLKTRGVVLVPEDLSMADWPDRASRAGLTTVALHHFASPSIVMRFVRSDAGQKFLANCARVGLQVEYELHAMKELLPRDMFAKNPDLFRLLLTKTLPPPTHVKPDPGVFLEYAPIKRSYDIPYSRQTGPDVADGLTMLDANLAVFPPATAQALEYWLDVSRFSHWNRPAVKLPWNREVFLSDLDTYSSRGMRHITTFAVWIDADYVKRFTDLQFIEEYGTGLQMGQRGAGRK